MRGLAPALLLDAAVELAVRNIGAQHGLHFQMYPRRHWSFWKDKVVRGTHDIRSWWCWYGKEAPLTFSLLYDSRHNRWGLELQHWWRLAEALRKRDRVWCGESRDLTRLLAQGLPRAVQAHNELLQPLVLADALERLTDKPHVKRPGSNERIFVEEMLADVGYSGNHRTLQAIQKAPP